MHWVASLTRPQRPCPQEQPATEEVRGVSQPLHPPLGQLLSTEPLLQSKGDPNAAGTTVKAGHQYPGAQRSPGSGTAQQDGG